MTFSRAFSSGLLPSIGLVFILFALAITDDSRLVPGPISSPSPDSPDEFVAYFRDIRTAEGETMPSYRPGYRLAALEEMRVAAKGGAMALPWIERGPGNVGGRTRAIIVDRSDPTHATWIVGAVGGGIWRTTNKGSNWTPVTDQLPRLAIGSLAQSPSRPEVMYAGTGEGYRNTDAVIGDGMFLSDDGGRNWVVLPATRSSVDFLFVNRLLVSPTDHNTVTAATNTGLHRSTDGGASWSRLKASTATQGFYQILQTPGDYSIQYAAEAGRGIWKSTDAGMNWVLVNDGLPDATSSVRIELDVSPANPDRIFALVEVPEGTDKMYVSDNGGGSWAQFFDNNTANPVDIAGTQGWYDLMVTAHPFNQNIVFLGGIGLYRATITGTGTQQVFVAQQSNTASFLSFINFGGSHLGGGLRLGTDESESTITPSKMVPVEVRFGPGLSQNAHRFVPPDQAGVAFSAYPYRGYVTVPFQVWDTLNNRQLMVSFRDRNDNGQFDLIENDPNNLGREYVIIHARTYNAEAPDPQIAQNGGIVNDLAYFFWPILASGADWTPNNLPVSSLQFFWQDATAASGTITSIGGGVHADQHVMIASPTGGTNFELVLGNDGGVFYSGDGGSNWVDKDRGYNTAQYYGVDKKPGADAYVGGTQDNGSWRSFVNPQSSQFWLNASGGDGFEAVWHKQNEQKMLVTSQWNFVQRSLNGGQSWTGASTFTDTGSSEQGAQFITVLDANPKNNDIVLTVGRSGVWRSIDFAETWRLSAIPEEDWGFGRSAKVRFSLKDPSVVWAGSEMDAVPGGADPNGKLHVSLNGGVRFSPVSTPDISPGRISGISTSFEDSATVYVMFSASNRAKILRSTDMGQSWLDLSGFDPGPDGLISQNGFPNVAVFDLLDFPGSARLWAATEIGIIESVDDGLTWAIADNGLPAVAVWQLRLLDGQIVAATHGRGVWTLPLNTVPDIVDIGTATETTEVPDQLELLSFYPNPVQSGATVRWKMPTPGPVSIHIFDLRGRLVETVLQDNLPSGIHEAKWRAEQMSAGSYLLRIESLGSTTTRLFVRLR